MSHHGHDHHASRTRSRKRLRLVLALVFGYMVAEIIGGLLTNSLALLADAGHMFSDAGALSLSLFAIWFAARPSGPQSTYGYYRTEILAALVNGATLVAVSAFIFFEAYQRLRNPPEVLGPAMMAVAIGGFFVNLICLWLLGEGKEESLNVRGAWLHVLSDLLGSVGAVLAGALIWAFAWNWVDPAISVAIGLLIIYSSWRLIKESVAVLMEIAPHGVDVDAVRNAMTGVEGVGEVHDLHIWTITSGMDSLSAHVVAANGRPPGELLNDLRKLLHDRFGIHHATIQIESEDYDGPCGDCC